MATTILSAFREFASNLNISDRQTTKVANCKNNVVAKIREKLRLHPESARVIGSWDRDTLTRYLREADVDVMIVLHHGENRQWDSGAGTGAALQQFKTILDAAYPNTPCRVDQHCVTMRLTDFRLDVVPAFRRDDGLYQIPDTHARRWMLTSPVAFAGLITGVNKQMNGTFVPLIKMVKGWNRHEGWPIKSFHLECLMHLHYRSYFQDYTYNSTLSVFLSALPEYLAQACHDPVTGERVDEYLDAGGAFPLRHRATFIAQRAAQAAADANALEGSQVRNAIVAWKSLLGDFFPAFG